MRYPQRNARQASVYSTGLPSGLPLRGFSQKRLLQTHMVLL